MSGNSLLTVLLAVLGGYVIWRVSLTVIRMLSTPPAEMNPEDVVPVDQDYRCSVCGAELTMRSVNVLGDAPPRHCREDMVPVWRP